MKGGMVSDIKNNRFIRENFLIFVSFLTVIFAFSLVYSLYSFIRISTLSNIVANEVLPRARGIQEATSSMLNSRFIFGEILGLIDPQDLTDIKTREAELNNSILIFDSYIAAFTWGSESAAFKKSDGGLNFAEWQRLKLADSIVIIPPADLQMQLAGAIDIYFSGFSINALKAIGNHKKFLRLKGDGENDLAGEAQRLSLNQAARAREFFKLASDTLSLMARESNTIAAKNVKIIAKTQKNALINISFVVLISFFTSTIAIWIYAKKIKSLLLEADMAAKLLVRGSRELAFTNQELVERNKEFNEIIKILVGRDLDLSRANRELADLDELKSKFVSTAAHELRTPLTALKWSLNELAEGGIGKLKKEQRKAVEDTVEANNRLIKMVNELLDLSRLGEGQEIFEIKKQDVVSILKDVCSRFQKIAGEKGIKLILETPSQTLPVLFDAKKLTMVFLNLIDNAIKYTPPGGQVSIKLQAKDNEAKIDVADTGIGIPDNEINHIFTRFFRASNAVTMEAYGTGLGLAVAKEIIDKHNGSISCQTSEGKGSVFTVNLPRL